MDWPWPYATPDVAPIPGRIKEREEDFEVEELPLYPASGEGTHLFLTVEKRGLTTADAAREVARAAGVPPHAVGFAGQKDARALTRQRLSVEHVDPARVLGLSHPRLRVLAVERHGNKLKLGHLAGNRFAIRVRGLPSEREGDARAVLERLARRGVPNYFGPQRFGARGDSWRIGRALLHGDPDEALAVFVGTPGALDHGAVLRARTLFEQGEHERAARAWPGSFRDARRAVGTLARTGSPARAVRAIDRRLLALFVSAWQSWLFNELLARRIADYERVRDGDVAVREASGGLFVVEDAALEAPRAERFEISPAGPLFGRRMTPAAGEPARLEAEVLAAAEESEATFAARGPWQPRGGRRSLRFRLDELALESGRDEHGRFTRLSFVLPSGCYATAVVAELLKRAGHEDEPTA